MLHKLSWRLKSRKTQNIDSEVPASSSHALQPEPLHSMPNPFLESSSASESSSEKQDVDIMLTIPEEYFQIAVFDESQQVVHNLKVSNATTIAHVSLKLQSQGVLKSRSMKLYLESSNKPLHPSDTMTYLCFKQGSILYIEDAVTGVEVTKTSVKSLRRGETHHTSPK